MKKNGAKGATIVSDYEILLPGYSNENVLRKIIVRDPESGKKIVLLMNNLKWAASTVSAIYKDRWQIALFFKAIKENLQIKRFYGNSKNAVMTQMWIALITYLLFYLLKIRNYSVAPKKGIKTYIHEGLAKEWIYDRNKLGWGI